MAACGQQRPYNGIADKRTFDCAIDPTQLLRYRLTADRVGWFLRPPTPFLRSCAMT